MTDIQMTRLCAEAMGYSYVQRKGDEVYDIRSGKTVVGIYWPIENDAQAMALVKKFRLKYMWFPTIELRKAEWWRVDGLPPSDVTTRHANLNMAIVSCVAKMQAAK